MSLGSTYGKVTYHLSCTVTVYDEGAYEIYDVKPTNRFCHKPQGGLAMILYLLFLALVFSPVLVVLFYIIAILYYC